MKTTIGDLRDQVTVGRITRTSDGMGGYTDISTTQGTFWAQVTSPGSRDGILADADTEVRTHIVRVRQNTTTFALQINDTVLWRGVTLEVKGVRPLGVTWVDLDCRVFRP